MRYSSECGAQTIQIRTADAIQIKSDRWSRIADITERKGGCYTNQEERRRLYKSRGHKRGRIADNTEREGGGYTNQEGTKGGGSTTIQRKKQVIRGHKRGRIADNTERKGGGYTNQEGTEAGSPTIQRGTAETAQINDAQKGEDRRQYREEC